MMAKRIKCVKPGLNC